MTKKEESAMKRALKLEAEKARVEQMCEYEKEYGVYSYICGIDEAGRGPLAGPVVAGAVILPKDCRILYINDSKKLSEKRRNELFDIIKEEAVTYGIGIIDAARIDEINILQATYEAMRSAINNLNPKVDIKQVPIIKGDAKSISIAAASVLAKVTRDRIMEEYDKKYPEYGFAKHKGYGTKQHIQALEQFGASPIHRRTFITKFVP